MSGKDLNTSLIKVFRYKFILFVLILIIGAGCASIKLAHQNYKQSQSGPYLEALKRWTAEARVYRGFETVYLTTGTYKSADFRRAYVRKYAKDYHLTSAAAAEMLANEYAMANASFEFIVAAYAVEKKKINLESRDSLWRVYLDIEGLGQQAPIEIRKLKKERIRLKEFYPYITPWVEVYRIRFRSVPLPESVTSLHLVQTGVLGTARLIFNIGGD
ncbi:MAG: hypothetical protein JRI34_14030 [Deltaproteobacteria bacterium]|nr:hypothetical protein [Deltaproteobacteria bacterium]